MKRQWMSMIFAAAITTTAALSAELHATIPFDFTASGKHMAAGEYTIARLSNQGPTHTIAVRNTSTRQVVALLASYSVRDNPPGESEARIVFKCHSGVCALAQVFNPGENLAHAFPTRAAKRGESERMIAVRLEKAVSAGGN